jgi:hypothetical protein
LGWLLVEEGFTLVREHEIESIFAVANGYIGTRASLEEGGRLSQPVTFAAGIYADDPASELGPALAVLPDWPHLEIAVDGDRLSMGSGPVIEHRRMLDLRQGVLWREWRQQDSSGRITRVRFLRLASLASAENPSSTIARATASSMERPAEVFEYFLSQTIALSRPSGAVVGRSIAFHRKDVPAGLTDGAQTGFTIRRGNDKNWLRRFHSRAHVVHRHHDHERAPMARSVASSSWPVLPSLQQSGDDIAKRAPAEVDAKYH